MKISRRYFLKSGGIAMVGMAALPSFLQRAVASTTGPAKKKMGVLEILDDKIDRVGDQWKIGLTKILSGRL